MTAKNQALQRLFNRARRKLDKINCIACDYDEAEGFLIDHCPQCCHKIVREMWQAFVLSNDARIVTAKPRVRG